VDISKDMIESNIGIQEIDTAKIFIARIFLDWCISYELGCDKTAKHDGKQMLDTMYIPSLVGRQTFTSYFVGRWASLSELCNCLYYTELLR
jgi:hypothetical protein